MTNKLELYKCNICGNVIEVLISGDGHPVCCGKEMVRIEPKNDSLNSPDLTEKHSPIPDGDVVRMDNHPMENNHYIMFVQAISKDKNEIMTKYFYPSDKVEMLTCIDKNDITARSYCNIHGLFVSNKENL